MRNWDLKSNGIPVTSGHIYHFRLLFNANHGYDYTKAIEVVPEPESILLFGLAHWLQKPAFLFGLIAAVSDIVYYH
jgi:hypothetical protein